MTVTRFAPSPTGYIHIGNLRAALFNWLIARKAGGSFLLRLDDTDPERSKEIYADGIREDLAWLGLTWDREERQSARVARYEAEAGRLREAGLLYEAWETPAELDLKRKKLLNMGRPPVYDRAALALSDAARARLREERGPGVWRFRLDQQRTDWEDGILGPVSIDTASVSDPVLIRADGLVLYTFASVVDDIDFGITDIVRGADHVTNTAVQTQIFRGLGGTPPRFAHHSLLTGPQGEALSKRLGTLSLRDLRAQGVEPMALISLMARLGSADPVELRGALGEIVEGFDVSRFGAAPTKFDPDDLGPLSARIVAAQPYEAMAADIRAAGVPDALAPAFWAALHENVGTRAGIAAWWALCRDGAAPRIAEEDRAFVAEAAALLPPHPYTGTTWSEWTAAVRERTGRKGRSLFAPLRAAVTGRPDGPDMARLMPLLQTPARLG